MIGVSERSLQHALKILVSISAAAVTSDLYTITSLPFRNLGLLNLQFGIL